VTLKRTNIDLCDAGAGADGGTPPPPRIAARERVPLWYHPHADTKKNETPNQDPEALTWLLDVTPNQANQDPETREDPTQRPRIEILLNHYRDVLEGLPDREHPLGDDGILALMCPAWNSPAYQQLEHLLRVLHERFPRQRQALRVRHERYTERKVAYCRKCGVHPWKAIGSVHSHPPGRSIALYPKMLRVLPGDDNPRRVEEAIEWLCRHWRGQIVIPKSVAAIEAERLLREAA
jgi:hypothetical protein